MRALRFRLPVRIVLALALAGVAVAGASVGAAAANGVTLAVQVGYQDVVKPGEWMPVTVVAKNSGAGIDGTLEIQEALNAQPGAGGFAIYQQPISLASGAVKRIRTYVVEDTTGATITARIVQNGRVIVSQDSSTGSTTSALIGVLSDQPTSLDGFAAVHPASIAARVVHLPIGDVADSAIVLRAFDILAIDDFATDSLTAAQRSAITDYVRAGGTLLLGTGAAWHKTLAGLSPAILPMNVSGTTSVNAAELGGAPVEVATGSLTSGQAWLAGGGQPLLLDRAAGAGSVTMATFDWNQEPVAGWSGTGTLLRQLLSRAFLGVGGVNQNFGYGFASGPGVVFQGMGSGFGSAGSLSSRSSALTPVLGNLPGLNLPSLQLTGVLVLLYILLVGPINYLVLGAMRRRALAWVTVPLIAVIAAGGAYGAGALTKGRSVQTNQVSIVHVQPGSDHAYQETYNGIMAPARGDYQASIAGSPLLISPISTNGSFGPGSGAGSIRVNVDTNGVTLPGMTAFVLGGFATESMASAPQLSGHLQLVNGKLTGTIENRSSLSFTDAVLISGDSFQTFAALRPGATAAVSLTPKPANPFGQPTYTRIYGAAFFNGPQPTQPTDAQREDYAKTQILALLPTGAGFKGVASAAAPVLVAWTHQPFQAITVNGSTPRATTESAVVLSLPVDQIGTGPLPAGIVTGRIVDVVGDTQGQGPPGMLLLQSGSVTYEFSPGLATGTHLTGVSLNSQNPYGAKFQPVPPGGATTTASGVQGQVWDWSRSTWTDVTYLDNGTTALSDSAINPATGLVRFRLTSTSGLTAGTITLSGTVQ